MERWQFPIRKGGIFCTGKEIEGLRGGVHWYAAQASPKIDAARTEKDPFRMETHQVSQMPWLSRPSENPLLHAIFAKGGFFVPCACLLCIN